MPDYRKMYFELAAKVEDAVELLVKAQQKGENDYMEGKPTITEFKIREASEKTDLYQKEGTAAFSRRPFWFCQYIILSDC